MIDNFQRKKVGNSLDIRCALHIKSNKATQELKEKKVDTPEPESRFITPYQDGKQRQNWKAWREGMTMMFPNSILDWVPLIYHYDFFMIAKSSRVIHKGSILQNVVETWWRGGGSVYFVWTIDWIAFSDAALLCSDTRIVDSDGDASGHCCHVAQCKE